jgi:pyruvate formate lyase activating enzyme
MGETPRGLVRKINRYSVTDGPGIRSVVFLKGCPLRCVWCSSPQTWSLKQELIFFPRKCIGDRACVAACPEQALRFEESGTLHIDRKKCTLCGSCADACPSGALELIGEYMTVDQIVDMLLRDRHYYAKSGGGLTLSGGEPLFQIEFSVEVLRRARENGINTAVETTGYLDWEKFARSLPHTDLMLYDLKHMDDTAHREFTGVSNKKIHENLSRTVKEHPDVRIVVCYPCIPGYNDSDDNISDMMIFMNELGIREIDIFAFHKLGMHEYEEMGIEYPLADRDVPEPEFITRVEERFRNNGFEIVGW